jgi:hypothetical protein
LRKWLEMQPPDHFLLIEPNYELCEIVAAEMRQAVSFEISSCGLSEAAEKLPGAIAVTLPNRAKTVRQTLPEGTELLELQTRSVPASLAAYLPAPTEALVGIASGWPDFLKLARTFLLAAGFSANSLVVRDTRKTHWQRGLEQTTSFHSRFSRNPLSKNSNGMRISFASRSLGCDIRESVTTSNLPSLTPS